MATIEIKITAEVPANGTPKLTAYRVLRGMALKADQLVSWQEIIDGYTDRKIGECHFQVIEDEKEPV